MYFYIAVILFGLHSNLSSLSLAVVLLSGPFQILGYIRKTEKQGMWYTRFKIMAIIFNIQLFEKPQSIFRVGHLYYI